MSYSVTPQSRFEQRPAPAPAELLNELAAVVERRTMMQFGAERRELMITTLGSMATSAGAIDQASYIRQLLAPGGETALMALIEALTINETTFFRNVPQLNLFSRVALTEVLARKRAAGEPKQLKLWSAGCSSGQEAYTLAMLATEGLLSQASWKVQILGTDISQNVLRIARRGLYPKARLDTMPLPMRTRYFDDLGDQIQVKDTLRRLVTFEHHNLRESFPSEIFDIIFCRNVMIYFSREEQARLARRFRERLAPKGFLFIGHSESFQGLDVGLQMRLQEGGVVYQK